MSHSVAWQPHFRRQWNRKRAAFDSGQISVVQEEINAKIRTHVPRRA
jgi:hypothetical protein